MPNQDIISELMQVKPGSKVNYRLTRGNVSIRIPAFYHPCPNRMYLYIQAAKKYGIVKRIRDDKMGVDIKVRFEGEEAANEVRKLLEGE